MLPPEILQIFEMARLPIELVVVFLLIQIRARLENHKVRLAVVERNLGISYPEEFKQ